MQTLNDIASNLGVSLQTIYNRKTEAEQRLGRKIEGQPHPTDKRKIVYSSEAIALITGQPIEAEGLSAAPTTAAAVAVGNHQIVLAPPQLPAQYSLETLRTGEAVSFEDPLAVAASFLQTAEALEMAMHGDLEARRARLQQTQQAKDAIAQKRQKLELEARLYQLQTQTLDGSLSTETAALQAELGKLQQFTQPAAPGVGEPSPSQS